MESEYISIETAKRIAELERELIEANESITWWSNRYKSMQEINKIQAKKIIDLTLKKDRAIEYCKLNKEFTPRLEDVENILNGENNE